MQEIRTYGRYLCVLEPVKADADGLVECLGRAVKPLGIDNLLEGECVLGDVSVHGLPVLVGCGTDGASANVPGQNGMRGKPQAALPWAWCYGHQLELACKDAFTSCLFRD